ncbi:MAG TPA: cobalamin-dependent protein [Kofleriaceae bacterium]|nr:cobalamin-dependent protein [Kofleriaceae bacterium]
MTPDDLAGLRDRYLAAQLAGDRREAVRLVLDGLTHGATVRTLTGSVIQASQDEIGRLWQQNRVTIAQEHMATAISQLVLAALFERAPAPPAIQRTIVIACVEGELHELPARLVADALQLDGFDVRYLGANVPHDGLIALVHATQPDLVGLSVTMSFNVPALRAAVARLRIACSAPIFIGGHALRWAPKLADELAVAAAGQTLDEVVANARRLVGIGDHA